MTTWRESTWRSPWLWAAIALLLVYRGLQFWDWSWLVARPGLRVFVGVVLVMQLVFIGYPLLSRDQGWRSRLWPGFWPAGREVLIAGGLLLLILPAMAVAAWVVEAVVPGQSLAPEQWKNLANAPTLATIAPILLISFTIAPAAEEILFRGFLHNALRARLPLPWAILLQAALFGFVHSFSVAHSVYAAVLGVVLTLVYEWRRTLLTPILIHSCINFIAALGVTLLMLQAAHRPVLGVLGTPDSPTCLIREVIPGSPAADAGVQPGDVIIQLDKTPIDTMTSLRQQLQNYLPGDEVTLTIERSGETHEIKVRLKAQSDVAPKPERSQPAP